MQEQEYLASTGSCPIIELSEGKIYPKNYIISVFPKEQDAKAAMEALQSAGFEASDLKFCRSADYADRLSKHDFQPDSFLEKVRSYLDFGTEEWSDINLYLEHMKAGDHVLHVHVDEDKELETIANILCYHGANTVKYFSNWSISNMPMRCRVKSQSINPPS